METGILSFRHGFCDWGFWSLPFIMQRWSLSGYKNCNFVWTWITYELQTLTSREFSNFLQQVAKYKDRPQILQMMNYKFCLYTGILPEVRQKYSRRTNAQFPSSLTSKNGNIAIPYKSNQQAARTRKSYTIPMPEMAGHLLHPFRTLQWYKQWCYATVKFHFLGERTKSQRPQG